MAARFKRTYGTHKVNFLGKESDKALRRLCLDLQSIGTMVKEKIEKNCRGYVLKSFLVLQRYLTYRKHANSIDEHLKSFPPMTLQLSIWSQPGYIKCFHTENMPVGLNTVKGAYMKR